MIEEYLFYIIAGVFVVFLVWLIAGFLEKRKLDPRAVNTTLKNMMESALKNKSSFPFMKAMYCTGRVGDMGYIRCHVVGFTKFDTGDRKKDGAIKYIYAVLGLNSRIDMVAMKIPVLWTVWKLIQNPLDLYVVPEEACDRLHEHEGFLRVRGGVFNKKLDGLYIWEDFKGDFITRSFPSFVMADRFSAYIDWLHRLAEELSRLNPSIAHLQQVKTQRLISDDKKGRFMGLGKQRETSVDVAE